MSIALLGKDWLHLVSGRRWAGYIGLLEESHVVVGLFSLQWCPDSYSPSLRAHGALVCSHMFVGLSLEPVLCEVGVYLGRVNSHGSLRLGS